MSAPEESLRQAEGAVRKLAEANLKWGAELRESMRRLNETVDAALASERRIRVNKKTYRVRFEGETEEEVTIVIEPKEKGGKR